MSQYTIQVPIEYEGDDKFNRILSALDKTAAQTEISDRNFAAWKKQINLATDAGYTLEAALNRVNAKLIENIPSIDAFTSRLKANIAEQNKVAVETEKNIFNQIKLSQAGLEATVKSLEAKESAERKATDTLAKEAEKRRALVEKEILSDALLRKAALDQTLANIAKQEAAEIAAAARAAKASEAAFAASFRAAQSPNNPLLQITAARRQAEALSAAQMAGTGTTAEQIAAQTAAAIAERKALTEAAQSAAAISRYEQVGGRIGGRVLGNLSGVPGGGFFGSQIVQSLGVSGGTAAGIGVAGAGILAGYELAKNADSVAKYAQEQDNLSKTLGTTSQYTQLLGRVADATGVSTNSLYETFKKLNKEVNAGGDQSNKTKQALADLGLGIEVAFEKPETQIQNVLGALRKVGDESDRERLIVNLLGESGRSLLPLVDTFDRVSDSIKRSGVIMDQDAIAKMVSYKKQVDEVGLAWEKFKQGLAEKSVGAIEFVIHATDGKTNTKLEDVHSLGDYIKWWVSSTAGYYTNASNRLQPKFSQLGYLFGDDAAALGQADKAFQGGLSRSNSLSDSLSSKRLDEGLAGVKASRADRANQIIQGGLGPKKEIEDQIRKLVVDQGSAREVYERTGDDSKLLSVTSDLESKRKQLKDDAAAEVERKRLESEVRVQRDKLAKALASPIDEKKAFSDFAKIPTEFNEILKDPGIRRYQNLLFDAGQKYTVDRSHEEAAVSLLKSETAQDKKNARDLKLEQNGDNRSIRGVFSEDEKSIAGALKVAQSRLEQGISVRTASTRSGERFLTPGERARRQYSREVSDSDTQYDYRHDVATGEFNAAQKAIDSNPVSNRVPEYLAVQQAKNLEIDALLIDKRTKEIDAIEKFNETIDKASDAIREQWVSGITSLIIGAQNGGGKGLVRGVKSFAEGQEKTILSNLLDTGIHKVFKDGNPLGVSPDSPLSKVFQGTVFGSVNKKIGIDPAVDKFNDAVDRFSLIATGSGGGGGGTTSAGGLASSLPGAFGGGSTIFGGLGKAISSVGNIFSNASSNPYSGLPNRDNGSWSFDEESGQAVYVPSNSPATSSSGGGSSALAKGAGYAAAGAGVIGGALQVSKGGARNVLSGGGGILGGAASIAMLAGMTGPAAPIVAAVGAVAALVAAVLPDPRVQRAQEIQQRTFQQQYLAPTAINLSASGNGGYADTDISGGVRSTNYSPYPVYRDPYLDIPRRTVIPGGTISEFGGPTNQTGAGPNPALPPVTLVVQALDAKSIIDRGADIVSAFHAGIQQENHPVITTLRDQIGPQNA